MPSTDAEQDEMLTLIRERDRLLVEVAYLEHQLAKLRSHTSLRPVYLRALITAWWALPLFFVALWAFLRVGAWIFL